MSEMDNAKIVASAKGRILDILKANGEEGATTWDLINATHHSGAARRVWDLQQEGHRIKKVSEGNGVYRWIYQGPPPPPREKLTQALLFDLINAGPASGK